MKNKIPTIIAIVIAVAVLIISAIIILPMINKSAETTNISSDTASDTVPVANDSSEPWLISYFAEMRGMYAKVESDNLSKEEQDYNSLLDEFNSLLNEYQASAGKGLSNDAQDAYENKVQTKLKEIETAYQLLDSPPLSHDSLLECVYELEAEIREANPDGTSPALYALETKTTKLKSDLNMSRIDINEANGLYLEYSKEFEELSSSDKD